MSKFAMSKFATSDACAEAAGYDAGLNGADTENCYFGFFCTPSLTAAWQRGKDRGERERAAAQVSGELRHEGK